MLVLNYTTDPHVLHVAIKEAGEWAFEKSIDVAAGEASDATEHVVEDYPTEPGTYVIDAWLDDQSREGASRFDVRDYDIPCFALRVFVEGYSGDSPHPDVGIAAMPVDCKTGTTTTP